MKNILVSLLVLVSTSIGFAGEACPDLSGSFLMKETSQNPNIYLTVTQSEADGATTYKIAYKQGQYDDELNFLADGIVYSGAVKGEDGSLTTYEYVYECSGSAVKARYSQVDNLVDGSVTTSSGTEAYFINENGDFVNDWQNSSSQYGDSQSHDVYVRQSN
jgi:hypothetical protein